MLASLITSLAYVESWESEQITPLGVTRAGTVAADLLSATFTLEGVPEETVFFSPDAVGVRMALYGLDTEEAAVEAIIREVVFTWSGLEPASAEPVDLWGGTDERIAVAWADDALAGALAPLAARIEAARVRFTPAPPLE